MARRIKKQSIRRVALQLENLNPDQISRLREQNLSADEIKEILGKQNLSDSTAKAYHRQIRKAIEEIETETADPRLVRQIPAEIIETITENQRLREELIERDNRIEELEHRIRDLERQLREQEQEREQELEREREERELLDELEPEQEHDEWGVFDNLEDDSEYDNLSFDIAGYIPSSVRYTPNFVQVSRFDRDTSTLVQDSGLTEPPAAIGIKLTLIDDQGREFESWQRYEDISLSDVVEIASDEIDYQTGKYGAIFNAMSVYFFK